MRKNGDSNINSKHQRPPPRVDGACHELNRAAVSAAFWDQLARIKALGVQGGGANVEFCAVFEGLVHRLPNGFVEVA